MLISVLKPITQNHYIIVFEDGSEIKSTFNIISDFRLFVGKELNETEVGELFSASVKAICYEKAITALSYRSMSRSELIRKLLSKGECSEAAEYAADKAESQGFINDKYYAESLVRRYAGKGYGAVRIKQELRARGIERDYWDEALCEMPEQNDKIDNYIRSRLTDSKDRKEVKKVCDGLARRGFSWGEIKEALDRFQADTEDYYEDY